jgi:methionyl-tRNA formyltransferase
MKIAFVGAVEFSRRALELLIEMEQDIVGVCTLEYSAFNTDHCDLGKICQKHGISWIYTPDINSEDSIRWLADKSPDVIFCFGWSKLLGKSLLSLAPLGVIGFHPAALPANRGRHPLTWALVLGLKETASTFFFMNEGADSGDILSQQKIDILDKDDATILYEKVTICALEQIKIFIPQLNSRSFPRTIQNNGQANTWRRRGEADGKIDWKMSARSIHNLVRGLTKPYVGAHFLYQEQIFKVWKTAVVNDTPGNIEPGKILSIKEGIVMVKCGEQGIRLLNTAPEFEPSHGEYL